MSSPIDSRKVHLKNQTFSIGAEDAAIQGLTNPTLSALVRDGSYQYVDAHFVLNHPKYVTQDIFGETVLTDYARNHMDECCLIFDLSIKSGCKERYHSECFLNRDETSDIAFDIVYGRGYQHASPEKRQKCWQQNLWKRIVYMVNCQLTIILV